MRNSLISCASRSGWIGLASDSCRGSRFWYAASSSARSSSNQALRSPAFWHPARRGLGDRGQDRARVADQAEVDVAVLADGAVVHVDLDHGRALRQPAAVAHPEVERGADDQDQVGVVEPVPPGQVEVVRVAGRQGAAGRAVHVGRDVQLADEVDRRVGAARGPDLGAEQHDRLLGPGQQVGQRLDVRPGRRCSWWTRGSGRPRGSSPAPPGRSCPGCRAGSPGRTGRGRRCSTRGRPSRPCPRPARCAARWRRTW